MTNRTYNRQDNLVTSIDVPGYPGLSFGYSYDENKNVTAETTGGVMANWSSWRHAAFYTVRVSSV